MAKEWLLVRKLMQRLSRWLRWSSRLWCCRHRRRCSRPKLRLHWCWCSNRCIERAWSGSHHWVTLQWLVIGDYWLATGRSTGRRQNVHNWPRCTWLPTVVHLSFPPGYSLHSICSVYDTTELFIIKTGSANERTVTAFEL